tara:strand:+ start:321 stop:626 length:306 start_codon:yes stop_codon:yes gene_type:complete
MTNLYTIKKTTLADARFTGYGVVPLGSNCNYTGQTVCWTILLDGERHINVTRKKDAVLIIDMMLQHFPHYDGEFLILDRLRKFALHTDSPHFDQLMDVKEV